MCATISGKMCRRHAAEERVCGVWYMEMLCQAGTARDAPKHPAPFVDCNLYIWTDGFCMRDAAPTGKKDTETLRSLSEMTTWQLISHTRT